MPTAPSTPIVPPPDPRERRVAALLAVAATVVMWAGGGIAIKAASTGGIVTAFYRLWIAIPALWAITVAVPARRRRLDRAWLLASLGGGTLFALHQLLYFTSLKRTSVANVAVIGALQPSLVLLVGGALLDEPATLAALGWSAVAVVGTAMVVLGSAGTPAWSLAGDLLAVLNLFAFTGYFILAKRVRARVGPWEFVVGMTTVSGLWMLLVALATGQALDGPRGTDWLIFAGLALLPGTLGHVLTVWAHAHVQVFVSSMLLLAVPVFATAGAVVLLGEPVTPLQMAGGATALVAIAAVVASRPREEQEELAESAAATEAP